MNWEQWKQPIPTNLEKIFGTDHRVQLLFRELLYRACNSDMVVTLDGRKHVALKRGQVLFGRHQYAKYLGWSAMTCSRALRRLRDVMEVGKQMVMQTTPNYTLVQFINYDEIVNIGQADGQATVKQRSSNGQATVTSNSDKSNENNKNEKTIEGEILKNPEIVIGQHQNEKINEKYEIIKTTAMSYQVSLSFFSAACDFLLLYRKKDIESATHECCSWLAKNKKTQLSLFNFRQKLANYEMVMPRIDRPSVLDAEEEEINFSEKKVLFSNTQKNENT